MTIPAPTVSRAVVTLALAAALATPAAAELRCGWYANPTPGNVILTDADDSWWLSTQGRPETPGLWDAYGPDMDAAEWVLTNGNHGYTCACAEGDFGPAGSSEAYVIRALRPLPLSRCLADPALPGPDGQ